MIQTPDQINMKSPMLAKAVDFNKLVYPVLCQPKLDGIRAVIRDGVALSRSMKRIPNGYIQEWAQAHQEALEGFDGELIVGMLAAPSQFQDTTSGVMSYDGEPDFTYYVFDMWDMPDYPAIAREQTYQSRVTYCLESREMSRIKAVPTLMAYNAQDVKSHMDYLLGVGAEGMILRHEQAPYKFGRSTVNEGSLLKWKQFVDDEAEIMGFEELMHNDNEQFTSETGHSKRSAHIENLRPGGMLGALVVCNHRLGGVFRIGSGFDVATRQLIWDNKADYIGKQAKFKYFPIGMKDLPRHPIFLGIRSEDDM